MNIYKVDNMDYEKYKQEVIAEARLSIEGPICSDTIRDSYERNLSIKEAASLAVFDTQFWNNVELC